MSELTTEGFGAALRRRREELGLSLEDVATSTRIRKTYLQALEDENLQVLPGVTYAVGFLRIYASQLGLPIEPLLAALGDDESRPEGPDRPTTGRMPRRRLQKTKSAGGRGRRITLLMVLLVVCATAYLYLQRRPLSVTPAPLPSVGEAVKPPAPPALPAGPPPAETSAAAPVASVELAVIPPEGGIVRMLSVGSGTAKISLDQQEVREYPLQAEQTLRWKVAHSLAVECSAPGLLRLWVEQQEVPVAELAAFTLVRTSASANRP